MGLPPRPCNAGSSCPQRYRTSAPRVIREIFGWGDGGTPCTRTRDSEAIQVTLDEIICATEGAKNTRLDLEQLERSDLDTMRKHLREMARQAPAKPTVRWLPALR
ncbi:MAG: low affinity iron permease family protein [Gemmatimonadota bacterium]